MKKIILLFIAIFSTANAFAHPFTNFYASGFGGVSFLSGKKNSSPGYAVGGSLGYQLAKAFRLEGEVAYRANTFRDEADWIFTTDDHTIAGEMKTLSVMANALIEIPILGDILVSYLGVGLGDAWGRVSFDEAVIPTFGKRLDESKSYVYQGILGVNLLASHKIRTALEYRYLGGLFASNHTIDLNLRIHF